MPDDLPMVHTGMAPGAGDLVSSSSLTSWSASSSSSSACSKLVDHVAQPQNLSPDELALGDYDADALPPFVRVRRIDDDQPDCTYLTLTSIAEATTKGTASDAIDRPEIYIEWAPGTAPDAPHLSFLGFQCAEFAFPVSAGNTDLAFAFFDRPGYLRPKSVWPLLIFNAKSGTCTLLGPLDHFHDQVLAVVPAASADSRPNHHPANEDDAAGHKHHGGILRWGWSGDIDQIPPGFTTTLVVLSGTSPNTLLTRWGAMVQEKTNVKPRSAYADVSTQTLSMWTDNGAAYWYRREPGMDLPTTLERTIQALEEQNIPVGAVELDSWFYDHEIARTITDVGYCDTVPPTGMLRWEPRTDALGAGGISGLRARIGKRPLILHSRHISSQSSYLQEDDETSQDVGSAVSPASSSGEVTLDGVVVPNVPSSPVEDEGGPWWVDGERAHPVGSELFHRWMRQASDWGATTYEQDWLVEIWMGMRQLRSVPGRIATWQNALNDAASEHDVSLIWCMATPADMALATCLSRVVAVRTCDDYRYAPDPAVLWRWHLTVSCMARALNLWPFKDVFLSNNKSSSGSSAVDIDGDPNAELEALLSALSGGPVGIGDRLGRTNREIVMRTCRADGVLIKPDMPLAALDCSLWTGGACGVGSSSTPLLWADTYSSNQWRYLVVMHAGRKDAAASGTEDEAPVSGTMDVAGCGGTRTSGGGSEQRQRLVYDWRTKSAFVGSSVSVSLRTHEWKFFVVCPLDGTGTKAVIGDAGVYATMGARRMQVNRQPCGVLSSVDVTGMPGEQVRFATWSASDGVHEQTVTVQPKAWTRMRRDASNGWCAL